MEGWKIEKVEDPNRRAAYTRQVLRALPEWFGNPEGLSEYCEKVKGLPLWAAVDEGGAPLGILAVTIHYSRTGDIVVMGVLPGLHRKGLGRGLYEAAESYFRQQGCACVMVKTLSDTADFPPYEATRRFYRGMGFAPLVTLTEMWDEENPCLIMLKALE